MTEPHPSEPHPSEPHPSEPHSSEPHTSEPHTSEPQQGRLFDPTAPARPDPPAPEPSGAEVRDGGGPVVVYTDGACSGNPGPGGWGWAVAPDGDPFGSGGDPATTNQRMELIAVLEALRALDAVSQAVPIEVVSDSTYVVNCFRDRWWVKWQRNGWKNAKKQPVANVDIWQPLVELVNARDVRFRWVKGHSGDPLNDLVDQLAVEAIPRLGGS